MRSKLILLVLLFAMLFSPVVNNVCAGEIASQNMTETESTTVASIEANNTSVLATQCGGEDAAIALGLFVFFLVLIAASSSTTSS